MDLLGLIFPRKCAGCGRVGEYLCPSCRAQIHWHTEAICLVCGRRAIGGYTHPACQGVWGIDRSILLAHYTGPIRKLIQKFKYRGVADEANFLASMMTERLDPGELQGFILTAVPLHWTRNMQRGFNQSELVSKALAGRLSLVYEDQFLSRSGKTNSQVELDKQGRARNVRGAFKVNSKAKVKGAKILLVDDVITTGATVRECAKVLKRAGAATVWAVALAHGN